MIKGRYPARGDSLDDVITSLQHVFQDAASIDDIPEPPEPPEPDPPPEIARKVGVLTPHENLVIKYASTATVEVSAEAVVLFNDEGRSKRFSAIDETVNITTSGENGLDTGTEANSTWYHIWAIGKEDGTSACILSVSSTSPTLPDEYTYKGYLGAIYNDSGGNFIKMRQVNTRASMATTTLVASGTATSYAAVNIGAAAPPTAPFLVASVDVFTSSGTAFVRTTITSSGSGTTGTYDDGTAVGGTVTTSGLTYYIEIPVDLDNGQFVYRVAGTDARTNIQIRGWIF